MLRWYEADARAQDFVVVDFGIVVSFSQGDALVHPTGREAHSTEPWTPHADFLCAVLDL